MILKWRNVLIHDGRENQIAVNVEQSPENDAHEHSDGEGQGGEEEIPGLDHSPVEIGNEGQSA